MGSCQKVCNDFDESCRNFLAEETLAQKDSELNELNIELLQTSMTFQKKLQDNSMTGKKTKLTHDSYWTPISPTATVGACGHNFNFSNLDPQDPTWTAEEFISSWEEERSKLSVPFYMYDGMVGMTNFSAAQTALQRCTQNRTMIKTMGHSAGELFIYQQLQHHPWRVANSKDAKIIVVPIAMTMVGQHYALASFWESHHNYFDNATCPGYDAPEMFDAVVRGQLFQQRPKDHLFIDIDDFAIYNHFSMHTIRGGDFIDPLNSLFAKQCTSGPWTAVRFGPGSFPLLGKLGFVPVDEACRHHTTLVAPHCPQEEGNPDNDERNVNMFFVGHVYEHRHKTRMAILEHSATMPNSTILITVDSPHGRSWPQCPNNMTSANWTISPCTGYCDPECAKDMLQHTQFALCPAGDNPSSSRMYDAVNFGAIPIFLSDEAFLTSNPFQCFVPYNHISVNVPESECSEDCGAALKSATARFDAAALYRTRQLIRHFRKDLLWKAEGSRVMENLLLTALQMRNPESTDLSECCGTQCSPI